MNKLDFHSLLKFDTICFCLMQRSTPLGPNTFYVKDVNISALFELKLCIWYWNLISPFRINTRFISAVEIR